MFIKEVSERGQLPATTGNEACSCGKMAEACICNSTEPHTIEVFQQPLCHAQPDTSTLSKVAASFKAAEGQALPMTDKCLCLPSTWRTEAGRRLPVTFQFTFWDNFSKSLQLTDTSGRACQWALRDCLFLVNIKNVTYQISPDLLMETSVQWFQSRGSCSRFCHCKCPCGIQKVYSSPGKQFTSPSL